MIDTQTAAQAAQRGSSGIWLDAGVITLIITNITLIGRDIIKSRRNGQMRPGLSPKCIEHGEKLAVVESKQSGYDNDIKEIKEDIKTLLQRIPERD